MNDSSDRLNRLQRGGVLTAAMGGALSIVGIHQGLDRFLYSYLFAFCFWCGTALGCLGLLMLNYLTGGRWGAILRRVLEAGALTLPVMLILFIPIAFGTRHIYIWTNVDSLIPAGSHPHKEVYLTSTFFIVRATVYFTLWIVTAIMLRTWSLEEDARGGLQARGKLETMSGPGLIVYVLAASFAAFDWTMSLEPEWYSTIYGMVTIVGQGLSALILAILTIYYLREAEPINRIVKADDFHDFGNMLLVFVMLSAYMSFSQFLIIWSGNLPEESTWYIRRSHGGWEWIAAILATCHFLAPFLLLLFRSVKRHAARLAGLAFFLSVAHLCECYWWVMPAFDTSAFPHVSDLAAPLTLGGVFVVAYAQMLKGASLLPLAAPELCHNKRANAEGHV